MIENFEAQIAELCRIRQQALQDFQEFLACLLGDCEEEDEEDVEV